MDVVRASHQEIVDAVLERALETVEDEVAASVAVVEVFGPVDGKINGLVFALYPFDRPVEDPPKADESVVRRVTARVLALYAEADQKYAETLESRLLDVVADEHRFQYELYRKKVVEPLRAAGVLEAERRDPFTAWAKAVGIYKPMPDAVAKRFVDRPAPWDGKTWSDRFPYLEEQTRGSASTAVRKALAEGDDTRRATRRLANVLGKHKARAELIARTEIQRISNDLARTFQDENKKHLLGVQCLTTLDDRVCDQCAPYDRQVFYYPPGQPDIGGRPAYPLHPRCRCRTIPLSKLWQKLGVKRPPSSKRPSMAGPTTDYDLDTWLRRMEHQGRSEIARRILGKDYAAWAAGKTLNRFAGLRPVAPEQMLRRTRATRKAPAGREENGKRRKKSARKRQ